MGKKKNLSGLFIGIALICVSITAFSRAITKDDKSKETVQKEIAATTEVFSDDNISITYTGKDKRAVSFKIANKSDSKYEVLVEDCYIDDEKVDPVLFVFELEAGKSANKDLMFYDEISGDKLEVQFTVRDINSFELLSDSGLIEIPISE